MASGTGAPLEDGDDFFRLGLMLSRRGKWKESIAAYQESLRVNPNNAQTYLNLGFLFYELGYDREAQEAFDKALKLQGRPYAR